MQTACVSFCGTGEFSAAGATNCTSCVPGKYQNLPAQASCQNCADGKYSTVVARKDAACDVCGIGKGASGATECVDCIAGKASRSCSTAYGAPCTAGQCHTCLEERGEYSIADGQTACSVCATTGEKRNFCVPDLTSVQLKATPAADMCTPCAAGRFMPELGRACPRKGKGSQLIVGHDCMGSKVAWYKGAKIGLTRSAKRCGATPTKPQCYACPFGKYQPATGQPSCTTCPAGKYTESKNTTSADQCTSALCTKGHFCPGTGGFVNAVGYTPSQYLTDCKGSCKSPAPNFRGCDRGTYGDAVGLSSQDQCKSCGTGRWSASYEYTENGQCSACVGGKFSSNTSRTLECSDECSEGKFSPKTAMSADSQCEGRCSTGRFSGATGYTANSQCVGRCPRGKHSDVTGLSEIEQCKSCIVGKFADGDGFVDCTLCGMGKYQNTAEQDRCIGCERGKYITQLEATVCDECSPGTYSQLDSVVRATCSSCRGGRWVFRDGAEAEAECEKLQCPVFELNTTSDHARLTVSYSGNRTLPSQAFPECEYGYTTSYKGEISCVWSGNPPNITYWVGLMDNELPGCIGVQCPVRPAPEGGRTNFTNERRYPDGGIEFKCAVGYDIHDPNNAIVAAYAVHCQANATWDQPNPTCERKKCVQLAQILGAGDVQITVPDDSLPLGWNPKTLAADWRFGDMALFSCGEEGVSPDPYSVSVCNENGLWEPDPRPVSCSSRPCENMIPPPVVPRSPLR